MIKMLLQYPTAFRIAFVIYALLVLWASLRTGGGPQPIEHFDKVMHLGFYGVFTIIAAGCSGDKKTFIRLSLFITGYGILMELMQSFVPSRFMSLADIMANTSGILIVVLIVLRQKLHH